MEPAKGTITNDTKLRRSVFACSVVADRLEGLIEGRGIEHELAEFAVLLARSDARVETQGSDEAARIAAGLNRLMDLLQGGLSRISDQIARLVQHDRPTSGHLLTETTRAVDELVQPFAGTGITKVAGIEARGFILGGAIASIPACPGEAQLAQMVRAYADKLVPANARPTVAGE